MEANRIPALRGIAHIGIAVGSLEESIPLLEAVGLEHVTTEEVPSQKVRVAALKGGGQVIELVEKTADDSPIAKFLEKRGPGIHHIAFAVDDLGKTLGSLKAAGVRLIDGSPRPGAFGKRIAFIHPKATGGILIELCDDGPPESRSTRRAPPAMTETDYDLLED